MWAGASKIRSVTGLFRYQLLRIHWRNSNLMVFLVPYPLPVVIIRSNRIQELEWLVDGTLERYPLGTSRYLSLWKDKIPSCTSQDLTRWFIHKLFYSFQLLSHTNKSWEVDTKVNRIIRAPEVPCLTSLSHRIIAGPSKYYYSWVYYGSPSDSVSSARDK